MACDLSAAPESVTPADRPRGVVKTQHACARRSGGVTVLGSARSPPFSVPPRPACGLTLLPTPPHQLHAGWAAL